MTKILHFKAPVPRVPEKEISETSSSESEISETPRKQAKVELSFLCSKTNDLSTQEEKASNKRKGEKQ